nr:hypothetical protein [Tanacetum cinerariifolium]
MENDEEDHALVADEVASTKFALMANTSAESKVFDNSLCSKGCNKNNDSLNNKTTDLTDKLFDAKNMIYPYKLGLAQVESRLVEYKERKVKYCEKIKTLEFRNGSNNEYIEILKKKIETLKQEKEGVDEKLAGLLTASKNLDNLIESQRSDKNKDRLGYIVVPLPPAQLYSSLKKNLSWTGLPEFADDTVTDYNRPSPTVESTSGDDQNRNPSVSETVATPITPKPFIKFVKPKDSQSKSKTDETKTPKKPLVKYVEQYRKPNKKPNKKGEKSLTPKYVAHRPYRPPVRLVRTNINVARPNRTSFNKQAHSYANRPFHKTSAVRSHYRAPWVSTVNRNFPFVNRKFYTGSRNFPTGNRKFPTTSRKFLTGSSKCSTADMGMKGKAVKPSACWFWKPSLNLSNKGPNNNSVSVMFKKYTYIDTQGRLNGCSRHMTVNISYLSDFEPFDGGYVSFGQGGCKITGKGTIKTGKLEFEYVYFMKDLKDFKLLDDANILLRTPRQHNMYSIDLNNIVPHRDLTCLVAKASADECMLWHRRLGKQHKAACRSKLVNSVTTPLHTLHMDLFGPTSDETSGILKKFITKIENLKDLKVKIIRTPQQNGVAEKRNRTLIEAARTMLADTKLPVTFWVEAVNTACYVQNRVLVNMSHNKTPYELFNGRSSAIGFLKPFGCHVMIFNTLNNLGKFKGKGDEGYFIGYLMSSKAFRVFNKRTRMVEENLHVEFLENKAIEKGVGPNLLFDIDSLTKSMNYVPVDAGTISSNLSGSGNPNPNASISNPPADQMETLTVETLIPTVSSPVSTTYSTDSQEPSSDVRLILKRVANQEETPSLNNILSLTNRFEDILRVTTNSDESNGVEADISNMETAIIAIYQMDVKSTFLYGTIDEEVYVVQLSGFQDLEFLAKVYKVEKAMYELHQAPRAWYVLQKEDGIFLSQDKYVGDILKKFGYSNIRSSNNPMDKENPWGKDETGKDVDLHLYRSMIGSLMYLTASRPDIMFAVCACARHQVTPKECHMHAVKRIVRYLKESPFDLVAYSNSDYSGATQDCKSTTGGCQFFGRRLILWQCKKQTIMATSTTEAEYVAAASCCGQVL